MKSYYLICFFFLIYGNSVVNGFTVNDTLISISSPNNHLSLDFKIYEGKLFYSLQRNNREIIKNSRLGFTLSQNTNLSENFNLKDSKICSVDETWEQPWGEVRFIKNNYNELKVSVETNDIESKELKIIFRIFDYGIGFRYEIPQQKHLDKVLISDEISEFNLTGNHKTWWIEANQYNRYEYLYNTTKLKEVNVAHTPITFEADSSLYLSIHEAALIDFASMTLKLQENFSFKADLVPWSDGMKVKGKTPLVTPWRTIQVSDTPGDLITSYLILNLNEPSKIKDVTWIKPMKYIGIWWEMHLGISSWGQGEKHGATTNNTVRYIDFAKKFVFDGVLVEGWNLGWDGDWIKNSEKFVFTKPYDDFDIEYLAEYAKDKCISLIGHHETGGGVINYESQMEDAFKYYNKLGIHAVKTGYVSHGRSIKRIDKNGDIQYETHHGQFMVRHYHKVHELAANYKIMINAHEPIKPTGLRRTYPNMMSREGARGQEFNAWSSDGGNPPEHTVILPFTRLLAGPMDFTPGIFDLTFEDAKPNNRVNSTLAKQLALYVVIYSPLQMAADLPENYENNFAPFKFIIDVPCDWEDTKVIDSKIGDYITIVRKDRNSNDWYLGSITDENSRIFSVNLDFLTKGEIYKAEIYKDGKNANWETNPYSIEISKEFVTSEKTLELKLAPGGGQAIRFSVIKK